MPQVYFALPADDLAAVDYLAEREHDGNRSGVPRRAGIVRAYECGTTKGAARRRAAPGKALVSGGGSGI